VLPPGEAAATVAYHRQIVDAMAAKDVTSAREALDEHFRDVERRLDSAIEATGEEVSLPTEFVS
jgi:DNA-binding GntR family transcriptional regulator